MDSFNHLKAFNKIYKEMDVVYHNYAKSCGLSDMAYWILYSMAEREEYFTQRDFCNDWFFAPQTVNSALKDLVKKGIICLESTAKNKKNKLIKPTEYGKEFIVDVIMPLIKAECESFENMSKEECTSMLYTTKKYITDLKSNVNKLLNEKNQAQNSGSLTKSFGKRRL